MKLSMIIFAVLFIFSTVNAQDFITYSGAGKVILTNGTTLEGNVEYSLSTPGSVHIKVGDAKSEKYKAKEVKEFFVSDRHYYALKAKGEITVGSDMMFAYIISIDKAKFRLFKYETQPIVVSGNNVPITTTIYIGLPDNETEAYPLADLRLNPSKKLAKYLEDCPALAQKVANKEKDFSYGMITSDGARITVVEKINEEYAKCK